MALIPVITKVVIGTGAVSMTLRDATGAYDVDTNPGGYGLPNMVSPPEKIGLTWREWDSTTRYANFVSADSGLIAELISGSGHKFLASDIGITKFAEGIQHIKYYPFVQASGSSVFTWDETAKTFTRTSGSFDPTAQTTENYVAVLALNSSNDSVNSKVLLLGDTDDWTSTTFTVLDEWTNTGEANLHIMWATEADLKVLIKEGTTACVAKKVGKLSKMKCCDRKVIDKLTDITMWLFTADVKVQCLDYQGAHDLITAAYKECTYCISEDCTTCNS